MEFYLINKPLNITSFDVIRVLKKKLNISKIWHTWTLDPLATGVLLIAVWNYTKLIPYFEKDTKEYEFSVKFDGISESYDLGTQISYISKEEQKEAEKIITKELIEKTIKDKFSWEIEQIPPKYSALKIWWKRALERIKNGEKFEIKSRKVNILNIELLGYKYPEANFKATVSAWTYIRSIAYDLWELFKTWWYVTKLKRTRVWSLDISLCQDLDNFKEEDNLDVDKIFKSKNFINLSWILHPNIKLAERGETILEKLNAWLSVCWKFNYPIWEDLFVIDWKKITNIITYDWTLLKPKRKI